MHSRLEAEEQLRAINTTAAGTGSMKDPKPYLRSLRKQAHAHMKARKATSAELQAIGITVVEE